MWNIGVGTIPDSHIKNSLKEKIVRGKISKLTTILNENVTI